MAGWGEFVLVCGRYKAVDERVRALVVTEELSVGDFVLSGGEPAALLVLDAVARLVPGVLGNEDSADTDSFGRVLVVDQGTLVEDGDPAALRQMDSRYRDLVIAERAVHDQLWGSAVWRRMRIDAGRLETEQERAV